MDITLKEARRLALHSQGLINKSGFGKGIDAVEQAITQLHYVQIDTISVVERAHNHVLQTRVSNYKHEMLQTLLSKHRRVFEYWSHAAAYLPIDDYRYYRPVMTGFAKKRSVDKKISQLILKRIEAEGPLQSRDFEAPPGHKSGGWWDWKPAKQVMEHLFLSGELMVSERRGFQKVYDLKERVLPTGLDISSPSDEERGQFYVRRMLTALGIADAREIGYSAPTVRRFSDHNLHPDISKALDQLVADGEVIPLNFKHKSHFCLASALTNLPRISRKQIRFLSPFDNIVINRSRLLKLFDFDYQLECYVPALKRKFGYFCLPILYGDAFIGRLDCKAVRKDGVLMINNLWLDSSADVSDKLVEDLCTALDDYRVVLKCETIRLEQISTKGLKQRLKRSLKLLSE